MAETRRTIKRSEAEEIGEMLGEVHGLLGHIECDCEGPVIPETSTCPSCKAYHRLAQAINLFKQRTY